MTAPATPVCANPVCANPVTRNGRPGRPPLYCTPACRPRPTPTGLHVEIDHDAPTGPGRPAGRVWLVRLHRGPHTVTIATGLGRPSAHDLADRITRLLDSPSSPRPGGPID